MSRVLAAIVCLITLETTAQVIEPQLMDLEAFGDEYMPDIRDFNTRTDNAVVATRTIQSPHLTKTIAILEESDLSQVTADDSYAKAALIDDGQPVLVIEISRYRSFDISWLNEELIHVSLWPGRCVELHTIYSTEENRAIYKQGFQHCGV